MKNPGHTDHRMMLEVSETLREGHMKATLRQRFLHTWIPSTGRETSQIRPMLKVSYDIPKSRFVPYIMIEMLLWDKWTATRHFFGCEYKFNKQFSLDTYYLYFLYRNPPTKHIIGLELNVNL